jgi:ABC-type Fe3+ transport system substrate-binding protein
MSGFFKQAPAGAAVICLVFATGSTARAETMDQLYEKAKAEKSLVIWKGGPVADYERWGKEFEAKFPGIKVSVTGGFSNVLDVRIDQQIKDKKVEVDYAVFQTVQDFVRWKKQGALARFKPEGWDKIHPTFRDKDGAWVAIGVNAMPYAYNPKLVSAENAPKSALDFLKAEYKGKLIAAYPADDDATLYDFYQIVKKYGWSYMYKYMANEPKFIQGHLGVARSIASGDTVATLDAIAGTSLGVKRSGQPQEIKFSEVDATPIWPLTSAIFKDAPHPNSARLFLTWFLDPAQQGRLDYWSPRSDVKPPEGLKPLFDYKVANTYVDLLVDEKLMARLRKRFEDYTGPVKNVGGVR